MSTPKFTAATVGPALQPGWRKRGPRRWGAADDTPSRVVLFRLSNSVDGVLPEYLVCEHEADLADAVHSLAFDPTAGLHWIGARKSWAFRRSEPAVAKFVALLNAQAKDDRDAKIRSQVAMILARRRDRVTA